MHSTSTDCLIGLNIDHGEYGMYLIASLNVSDEAEDFDREFHSRARYNLNGGRHSGRFVLLFRDIFFICQACRRISLCAL